MYKLCFRIIKVCISFCIMVFINLGSKQTIVYTGIHHPRTDSWASWNWERMRLSVSEILGSLSNITYPLQEDPLSVLCISVRHQTKCKKQKAELSHISQGHSGKGDIKKRQSHRMFWIVAMENISKVVVDMNTSSWPSTSCYCCFYAAT